MADSQFDMEIHEADDGQETIKCGAIQLNLEKLAFSFTCIYCELELDSFRGFAEHFQQHLVMTDAENELFLNNAEEDSENTQSVDESLHDVQSIVPSDEEVVRDYQIEMLDDTTQDDVELLSNNENSEDQYVFQIHVYKNFEEETELEETLQPNNNEIQQPEIEEAPDLGFDIVPEESLNIGNKIKKDTNFVCDICGIKFTEASILKMHLQRHNRCQCRKDFSSKAQLKAHIKATHAAEKPFVCEECGRCFKNSEILAAHLRRHIIKQLYLCNTCGKSFYEERALHEHIQTHTSARPFICKECNMTFSRQEALMLHARMHTDIRKFSCTICRMTFAQNSGLLTHMKDKHRSTFDTGE